MRSRESLMVAHASMQFASTPTTSSHDFYLDGFQIRIYFVGYELVNACTIYRITYSIFQTAEIL